MRRGYLLLTLMLCISTSAFAQKLDADYYVYPLRDVAGYYSANFGEMRPNHFHSGTDFKTDGVEGKSVVAVADGYVSRVLYSPSGYGLALYIAHPNGTISVYGHLSRFRKDIAEFVFKERHRQQHRRKRHLIAQRHTGRLRRTNANLPANAAVDCIVALLLLFAQFLGTCRSKAKHFHPSFCSLYHKKQI